MSEIFTATNVLWGAAMFIGSLLVFALVAGGIFIAGHMRGVISDGQNGGRK